MTRPFESLTPEEVLALAIQVERANSARYHSFADSFRGYDDKVAARFEELAQEEDDHEAMLTEKFRERFGDSIPVVEEVEVSGVIEAVDLDDADHFIFDTLDLSRVYKLALAAEEGAQAYYQRAQSRAADPDLQALYAELAGFEDEHVEWLRSKLETGGQS